MGNFLDKRGGDRDLLARLAPSMRRYLADVAEVPANTRGLVSSCRRP